MVGIPRKKKKVGVLFEGHLGKKTEGQWKVAERILGHWMIEGTEPYKVCEEDEELMGSRNLLESRRKEETQRFMSTFLLLHSSISSFKTRLTGWLIVGSVICRMGILVVQLGCLRGMWRTQKKLSVFGYRSSTISPSDCGQGRHD